MTDALTHVRETIKVLRRHGCDDSQIVGILLDMGETADSTEGGSDDRRGDAGRRVADGLHPDR